MADDPRVVGALAMIGYVGLATALHLLVVLVRVDAPWWLVMLDGLAAGFWAAWLRAAWEDSEGLL